MGAALFFSCSGFRTLFETRLAFLTIDEQLYIWSLKGFRLSLFLWKYPALLTLAIILLAASVEGTRAEGSLVTVDVEGLSGAEKKNVELALELPTGIVRDGQIQDHWLKRYVEKIPENVDLALQPFGFYNSRSSIQKIQDSDGNYRILITVEPGPETRIRTLDVRVVGEGADNSDIRRVRRAFPLKEGGVLDHQAYAQGKLDLRVEADDEGYINAEFLTHKVVVFPEENLADVELVLETGPLYYFGAVDFVDEIEQFDEAFLRRFLAFREGDIFSHKKLHQSRLRFYGANRFQEIQLVPLIEESEGQAVPVEVHLSPAKMQRLRPGIGYGTDLGARVLLSYQHMNIYRGGHALMADFNIAEKQQSAEVKYIIPRQETSTDNLLLTLGYLNEELSTYDTEQHYAEIERAFGLGFGRTGSVALRYLREDYEIGVQDDVSRVTMPALRYDQRSFDDNINPKRGYQFRLEVRGAYDDFLSDLSLIQVLGAGSFMLPLTRQLTLHTRVEGATTLRDDDFKDIPPSLRFFVGGDKSVRGYSYKSRGPRDRNGDVIGGDSLLVGSVECEYAMSDAWGMAVFYDIGSAFNAPIDDIEYIEGVGVGFRRYTPVGPIKIDFAHRLSESHSVRLHLSIGFEI